MEKFFPADKIIMTKIPSRQNLTKDMPSKEEALRILSHLQPGKKTILIVGGSLVRTTQQLTLASQSGNHQRKTRTCVYLANGQIHYYISNRSRKRQEHFQNLCNGFHQRYGSRLCSSRSGYLDANRFHSEFCLLHRSSYLGASLMAKILRRTPWRW